MWTHEGKIVLEREYRKQPNATRRARETDCEGLGSLLHLLPDMNKKDKTEKIKNCAAHMFYLVLCCDQDPANFERNKGINTSILDLRRGEVWLVPVTQSNTLRLLKFLP